MLELINSEAGLAALMAVGFVLSVFKQWHEAAQRGATIDGVFVQAYFVSHWVETVIALIGCVGLFAVAMATGQLNVLAALTCGYTGNSLADLLAGRAGTRTILTGGKQ